MITFQNITLRRGNKLLFQDVQLTFYPQQKVGIIGENGSGKSSLFALLLRTLTSEQGSITYPKDWNIAYVPQEIPHSEAPILTYVMEGDVELQAIQHALKQAEQAGDGEQIAHWLGEFEVQEGYTLRSRAECILMGLGFTLAQLESPIHQLSGGWRARLNLAKTLIRRSEVLLLDEPTNHLDLPAILWLEQWLSRYPGLLLLVSHDREFLDHIVTNIAHIENQKIQLYSGNYSAFEKQRAEALVLQQKTYEKQQTKRAHAQKYIDRFRYKATKAKQAQSRMKMLDRMEVMEAVRSKAAFHFEFLEPASQPDILLQLEHVDFKYQEDWILKDVYLQIESGMRVGLLGPNGVGKSTLMKMIAGQLEPTNGRIQRHPALQIGYFSQYQFDRLRDDESPLDHLTALNSHLSEQELRNFLGSFNFSGDRVFEPVGSFSGGERARLILAIITLQKPNLLLLDEPANHLDMDMQHALIQALQGYTGAMIVVSHDRFLLNATTDQLYHIENQHLKPYDGTLEDYLQWIVQPDTKTVASKKPGTPAPPAPVPLSHRKLQKKIEMQLTELNQQAAEIDNALAASTIYDSDQQEQLKSLLDQHLAVDQKIKQLEQDWLKLEEKIDQTES